MKYFIVLFFVLISNTTFAQIPKVASGSIRRFENFESRYVQARTIDVWLPEGYSPNQKYAVLYMHDGQMLYDSTTTWNKQEWGVDEVLTKLINNREIKNCIVVGIWNGGKLRHSEYFPQKPFEALSPNQQDTLYKATRSNGQILFADKVQSDNYLKFLVTELKPFIDQTFSTYKNQANTFIAGSSMGGLISMYAICEYPKVFGGAACLSTHWTGIFRANNNPIPEVFMHYLRTNLPSPKKHKIYFDYGTATLDALYKPFQEQADAIMKQKGYTPKNWQTKEFVGQDHSEKAWNSRLHLPIVFLLGK
jgi:enterochelin esterase-like enzyme